MPTTYEAQGTPRVDAIEPESDRGTVLEMREGGGDGPTLIFVGTADPGPD